MDEVQDLTINIVDVTHFLTLSWCVIGRTEQSRGTPVSDYVPEISTIKTCENGYGGRQDSILFKATLVRLGQRALTAGDWYQIASITSLIQRAGVVHV
jgi:hypothetical protein